MFSYLNDGLRDAHAAKDEVNFDWYSDAQEAFFQILRDKPIRISRRVKPL